MATQLDLYRDDPKRIAEAYREAAQTELINPNFNYDERQKRHDYYVAEAARMEANHG